MLSLLLLTKSRTACCLYMRQFQIRWVSWGWPCLSGKKGRRLRGQAGHVDIMEFGIMTKTWFSVNCGSASYCLGEVVQ